MSTWHCSLCSYPYDEANESEKWQDLADSWVCPVCGSGKEQFVVASDTEKTKTPPVTEVSTETGTYVCNLCSFTFDEATEPVAWNDLPDDWACPVCGSSKEAFTKKEVADATPQPQKVTSALSDDYLAEWRRNSDNFEIHMADIHTIAMKAKSVQEPMRTQVPTFSWDEILVKGAQLFKIPLNKSQPVATQTVIGPKASKPMIIDTPIIVSHMSFGALSKNAKVALSKGSALAKTAICSGEGGIIPESLEHSYKYIFEYVPNKYSVTDSYLQQVDAIEIKIGQSAKPGMGGHLPGHKVTREIAKIRGFREGADITSPSHFPDIRSQEDLNNTVSMLRERSGGKPIGIKLAAGNLAKDIAIALNAEADFITVDGRAGGTGSAPKVVKAATSIPTIFALAKARQILDEQGASEVTLLITGGFRSSSDMAKALAMGADAIALATASMMAMGCQQYRICDTGKCPVGIATHDPALTARLDIDKSAERVGNFFNVCTEELKDFARLTGNEAVSALSIEDICTTNSEISNNTTIDHV